MTELDRPTDAVRDYFERNTARFERWGQAGTSIHRAVWGPGVSTRSAAVHFVDELVLAELASIARIPRVLDLGCGVGASLLYLAKRRQLHGEGVTISPLQAERAAELVRLAGASQLRCREADFLALPRDIAPIDVAFSIEAFVLAPSAAGFFSEASRVLGPGGKLVVCDDFLTPRGLAAPSAKEANWLSEFRSGWRVGSLITVAEATRLAEAAGLRLSRELDLTPYLELRRPRDRCISALVGVGKRLHFRGAYWGALVGGNALQLAIVSGVVGYSCLVFERIAQ